jgi:hypothetical protein
MNSPRSLREILADQPYTIEDATPENYIARYGGGGPVIISGPPWTRQDVGVGRNSSSC